MFLTEKVDEYEISSNPLDHNGRFSPCCTSSSVAHCSQSLDRRSKRMVDPVDGIMLSSWCLFIVYSKDLRRGMYPVADMSKINQMEFSS